MDNNGFSIQIINDNMHFLKEMIKKTTDDDNHQLGYPRCDNVEELIEEFNLYDNTIENCVFYVYRNNKPISVIGFLYTENEIEGYLIGPMTQDYYNTYEINCKIIEIGLDHISNKINKIFSVVSDKNKILNKCFEANVWNKVDIQREMCFDIVDRKKLFLKYNVIEVDKENTYLVNAILDFYCIYFNWENRQEKSNEILQDEYKLAYIQIDNKVIGVICWAYIPNVTYSRLEYVAVDKMYQNKGIARSLINYVINDNMKKNIEQIYLSTSYDNTATHLYKKMGFYDTIISTIYERNLGNE